MKPHEEIAASVRERQAAEDGIFNAIEGLSVPDALGALAETQAQILADHGILPDTPAFEAYAAMSMGMLAGRVGTIARQRAGITAADAEGDIENSARDHIRWTVAELFTARWWASKKLS